MWRYGLWYNIIWSDAIWSEIRIWYGVMWNRPYEKISMGYDFSFCDMMVYVHYIWYDFICYGVRDMTKYDPILYDIVWTDMITGDTIWWDAMPCYMTRRNMGKHMIWYDTMWCDGLWYDIALHGIEWDDTTLTRTAYNNKNQTKWS